MTNNMFFIANWKMFGDLKSVNSIKKVIKISKTKKYKKVQIIYCPPFTLIDKFLRLVKNSKIKIGAQNCHYSEKPGPFTGSISTDLIKFAGAKYVIIGHSENRTTGDTNKIINLKIKSALKKKIKIIFCIGETLKEKRKKITKKVLNLQLRKGLNKIKNNRNIIIAYEPVWSIGTGLIPKSTDLSDTIDFIKSKIKKNKVLYGGSVNPKNIIQLRSIDNIDGFLVGGASQDAKKFIDIIKKSFN